MNTMDIETLDLIKKNGATIGARRRGSICQHALYRNIREATAKNMTIIGFPRTGYRLYRFNQCGHEQEIRPCHIRGGRRFFKCEQCFTQKIEAEALASRCPWLDKYGVKGFSGLTLIGSGKNSTYRTYRFNRCGHEREFQLTNVRNNTVKCKECVANRLQGEADASGLTVIGASTHPARRLYRFNKCGHEQHILTPHVREGFIVCHSCEVTSLDQPSDIYLLKIKVEYFDWLKLGYTRDLKYRISRYGLPSCASTTTLALRSFDTGREARSVEGSLHTKYRKKKLNINVMKKFHTTSGFDECYPIYMLDTLSSELNNRRIPI
jgi:hypothetical protein